MAWEKEQGLYMPSDTLALHHNIAVLNSQSTNVLCSLSADVAQRSDVIYSPCSFSQYSHFRCGLVVASLFSMTYDGVIVTSPVLEPYELTRFSNSRCLIHWKLYVLEPYELTRFSNKAGVPCRSVQVLEPYELTRFSNQSELN